MSFLFNLFSPRVQADPTAAGDETFDAAAMNNDPLFTFFNDGDIDHLDDTGCDVHGLDDVTYPQWRNSRKQYLLNFLERRLFGVDDEATGQQQSDNGSDEREHDECSFCSEVLDEEFDKTGTTTINKNRDTTNDAGQNETQNVRELQQETAQSPDDGEEEEEEDMLDTQPQTQLPTPQFLKTPNNNNSARTTHFTNGFKQGETTGGSIDTAELVNRTPKRGFFSGIKRKLGLETDYQETSQSTKDSDNNNSFVKKTPGSLGQSNTKRRKCDAMTRGLMCSSVPHVSNAFHSTNKLFELDMHTKNLDVELSTVLRIWKLRNTKRMNTGDLVHYSHDSTQTASQGTTSKAQLIPYQNYQDDGPLNTIYKKVLSFEVVQLDLNENNTSMTSPLVSNLVSAPFQSGQTLLKKVTERKRRHEVKRIKIFFYNKYAEAIARFLSDSSSEEKKTCLLSLSNIPPHCIMPLETASVDPTLQHYVSNPFGDTEHGSRSSYCICIGDSCSLEFGQERLHFDNEALEVGLVQMIDGSGNSLKDGSEDIVVNAESVRGGGVGYYGKKKNSVLIERYWNHRRWMQQHQHQQGGMTILVGDEQPNPTANSTDTTVLEQVVKRQNDRDPCETDVSQDLSAGKLASPGQTARVVDSDQIFRPKLLQPLSAMRSLLLETGRNKIKKFVTCYGVVLGFSPPSLTATREWKMSVVLIDDTLPNTTNLPSQAQVRGHSSLSDGSQDNKEVHVPSITVVLFVKQKSHLPVIRSAGDIVCCHDALLQKYNDEPQLLCNRKSNIVVVRPARVQSLEEHLQHSNSSRDWILSCSCHDDRENADHPHIHWSTVNSMWQWGQRRLSSHPTMSPNCKISIAGLDQPTDNMEVTVSGDMTAAVTAIIPFPDHLRRRDTPRGYIRLWDGSGPPISDLLPPDVIVEPNQNGEDPPEKVLVEIEKTLKILSQKGDENQCHDIIAPVSLTGRVINAKIWEEELWQLIQKEKIVEVGSFIRLRNINNVELLPNLYCLSVHGKSSMTPLPCHTFEVQQLLKNHHTRIQRGASFNPSSGILPGKFLLTNKNAITNRTRPFLENFIRQDVPSTFTAQFYISRMIPSFNPSSSNAIQKLCCKNKNGSYGFRFAFHIFDDSTEIDVLCLGVVAEELIRAKAQDIVASPSVRKKATETLNDVMTPGYLFEGEISSVLGKDHKVYYILKSMTCLEEVTYL